METIDTEETLLAKLQNDVEACERKRVVVLAGHFPVLFDQDHATEGLQKWGAFSEYSLELGCAVAAHAKRRGKQAEFFFSADDHTYAKEGKRRENSKKRRAFYQAHSGKDAKLSASYQRIMQASGFSEQDVIRQDQGKIGRRDCLYFSELLLRKSTRPIENACAREYTAFLEDKRYFDKSHDYLIAFITDRCTSHICNFVMDPYQGEVHASHIFMQTDEFFLEKHGSRDDIWKEWGVLYRKDG